MGIDPAPGRKGSVVIKSIETPKALAGSAQAPGCGESESHGIRCPNCKGCGGWDEPEDCIVCGVCGGSGRLRTANS